MASIKNFGLVGIGNDVQFGKGGARLVADASNTLLFKGAAGNVDAIAKAGELYALGLADALVEGSRVAAIDTSGKLLAGGELIDNLANKEFVNTAVTAASDELDELVRAIAATAGLTIGEAEGKATATVSFEGGLASAATLRDAINALEANKLNLSGGVMTGQIEMKVEPTLANHLTTKAYVDAAITGLSWEKPVDAIVADKATADLSGLAVGGRVFDEATGKIYTVITAAVAEPATPAVLDAGEEVQEGGAFYSKETDAAYVFNGVELVQFTGGGSLVGGTGIDIVGNVINIDHGEGLTLDAGDPASAKKLMLKLAASGAVKFDVDGSLAVKLAAETSGLKIAADGGLSVDFDVVTAGLQAELDASQASLGLNANGSMKAFTGASYLNGKAEVPAVGNVGEEGYVPAIPGVPAAANYHEALLALDSALKEEKDRTDAAFAALGSMSKQNADAVAITGGSVAVESLTMKGAHQGSIVFVGSDGLLMSDESGVTYDATSNTLTVGKVVSAAAPEAAGDLTNKGYVDAEIAKAVGVGSAHSARGMHIAFVAGTTTLPAFDGLVTRVKVKITTAGTAVSVAAGATSLVPEDAIDAAEKGLYIMEAADLVSAANAVTITSSGAEGIMIIEYVEADSVKPVVAP